MTGTIGVTSGALVVDKSLTITGPGANLLAVRVDAQQFIRAFQIMTGPTVVIEGLTISGSYLFQTGGGISNATTLTLANCVISGTHRFSGVYNEGMLTVLNSTINNNSADLESGAGGGINNVYGTLTIANSTVDYNSASGGGGISSYEGILTITGSTIAGNFVFGGGGVSASGTMEITDSTISSNTAGGGDDHIPGSGGAIFAGAGTISNSTITGNTA
jgi:hypothetical protein